MTERSQSRNFDVHESGERAALGERPTDDLAPGTVVAGKYRIKAVLGRGGFAVVYDAEHLDLGREVALKVLQRSDGMPHVLIERFLREVRISALVRHANVLEVFDAGVHDDGSPFLAMEKIVGLTLHQRLFAQTRLSVEETLYLSRQLLSALVAIGARGIVHRDIKPENLMLSFTPSGETQLKLVDFGIALLQEESLTPRLTLKGALVGTPHYMAPEQLRCELTDARVDVYAVGVVMYQALTGELPYDGEDLSSLTLNVLNGKARSLRSACPECPGDLARVIERALARDPEQRFADASSMLSALERCTGRPSRIDALLQGRTVADRIRLASTRPREMMIAGATLALVALWTGHASLADALRGRFPSRYVEPSSQMASASAPIATTRLPAAKLSEEVTSATAIERQSTGIAAPESAASRDMRPDTNLAAVASAPAPLVRAPAPAVRSRAGLSDAEVQATARARALAKKGLALYLHAELDAAYAVYRQATLLAPGEAASFRGLGLTASRLGRAYEARRAFTRYLELAPDAPDARLIRARLAGLISEEAARGLRGG